MIFSSFFSTLLLVFLTGCTAPITHKTGPAPAPKKVYKRVTPEVKPFFEGPSAVWYLFEEDEHITLYLKNLDDGFALSMNLEKGMTRLPIPAGHWELTGFEKEGESFTSMNTSKKFVFRVKGKNNVYAGSLLIGCPRIEATDMKYLKAMKYFDRYPFSSADKLCEMVIGNDFAYVNNQFKKSYKKKGLILRQGL